ncbi:hypothetical protein ACVGXT_01165 [Enterobacter intestinihominis]
MIEADRLVSAGTIQPDDVVDRPLRPKLLDDYNRPPQVRYNKQNLIHAAKLTGDELHNHFIFFPPRLCKKQYLIKIYYHNTIKE